MSSKKVLCNRLSMFTQFSVGQHFFTHRVFLLSISLLFYKMLLLASSSEVLHGHSYIKTHDSESRGQEEASRT